MDAQGDFLLNELESASKNILDMYEIILEYGNEEFKKQDLYLKQKEELCTIKHNFEVNKEALEVASEAVTIEEFDEILQEFLSKEKKKNFSVKRTNEYKDFKKQLNDVLGSPSPTEGRVECDDFVMESAINIYDPLTKLKMVDPVRNTICGHHYDKTSIMEAIKLNKRLRCPVAGCGNKEFVSNKLIEPDEAMKTRLMNISEG